MCGVFSIDSYRQVLGAVESSLIKVIALLFGVSGFSFSALNDFLFALPVHVKINELTLFPSSVFCLIFVWAHVHLCACVWRPKVNLRCWFLTQGLSLAWRLPSKARLAGQHRSTSQQPHRSTGLHLTSVGMQAGPQARRV